MVKPGNGYDGFELNCPYGCQALQMKSFQDMKSLPKNRNFSSICHQLRKDKFMRRKTSMSSAMGGKSKEEMTMDELFHAASLPGNEDAVLSCDGCVATTEVEMCEQCGGFFCQRCMEQNDHMFCCSSEFDLPPVQRAYPFLLSRARATLVLRNELQRHSISEAQVQGFSMDPKHCQCHIVTVTSKAQVGNASISCSAKVTVHVSEALGEHLWAIEEEQFLPSSSVADVSSLHPSLRNNDLAMLHSHVDILRDQRIHLHTQHFLQLEYQRALSEQLQQLQRLQLIRNKQLEMLKELSKLCGYMETLQKSDDDEEDNLIAPEHFIAITALITTMRNAYDALHKEEQDYSLRLKEQETKLQELQAAMKFDADQHSMLSTEQDIDPPIAYSQTHKQRAEQLALQSYRREPLLQCLNSLARQRILANLSFTHTPVIPVLYPTNSESSASSSEADPPNTRSVGTSTSASTSTGSSLQPRQRDASTTTAGLLTNDKSESENDEERDSRQNSTTGTLPNTMTYYHYVPFFIGTFSIKDGGKDGSVSIHRFVINGQSGRIYLNYYEKPKYSSTAARWLVTFGLGLVLGFGRPFRDRVAIVAGAMFLTRFRRKLVRMTVETGRLLCILTASRLGLM